jgi:DNA-binding MarR family transcriptional regulator
MLEQAMAEPYYTLETLQPERSVGYLIKRCGVLMTQIAERSFELQPISFTQWIILISLTQRTHASPTELTAFMGHDMGALTRLVDELERNGLVRRERTEHDRRAVQIAITPEGRRLAHAGKLIVADMLNKLVEPYSTTEIDLLISLLQRLLAQMQEAAKVVTPAEPPSAAPKKSGNRRQPRRKQVTS